MSPGATRDYSSPKRSWVTGNLEFNKYIEKSVVVEL